MYGDRIDGILQAYGQKIAFARFAVRRLVGDGSDLIIIHDEIGGEVSVTMTYGETGLAHRMRSAVSRIEVCPTPVFVIRTIEISHVSLGDGGTIIEELRFVTFTYIKDHRGAWRGYSYLVGMDWQAKE